VLVIADHNNITLQSSILNVIKAGSELGSVDVLVAGNKCKSVCEQVVKLKSVKKVFLYDKDYLQNPIAENITEIVLAKQKQENYTHILAPANSFGKNIIPRIGGKLDVQPISEILKIIDESTFIRPIYAGNALVTLKSNDPVKVMTVRATAFPKIEEGGSGQIVTEQAPPPFSGTQFISQTLQKSERPELTSAKIIVSGGRALKSGDNFKILYDLADKLKAAVGASRAAVDAGYVPNDLQIGQTGKIVAPELYIAIGISGAIQHLAGMKDSKVIVCINTDPEAPIFQVSDYGLVGDLFKVVPELTIALSK